MPSVTELLKMRIFGIKTDISAQFLIMLAAAAFILPWRWLIAMLTAATVHEMGHLALLRIEQVSVDRLTIGLSGARIIVAPLSLRQELLCACAGPGAAAMLIGLGKYYPELAICAFVQSVYNLIPVMPFDGGRIFQCALRGLFPQFIAERITNGTEIVICLWAVILSVLCFMNRLQLVSLVAMLFAASVMKRKIACKGDASAVQ